MASRPLLYEFPSWRDTDRQHAVTVSRVLSDLAKSLGHIPETLDDERAVRTFADSCAIPLTDLDIESTVEFPCRRYASRQYVRDVYTDFYLWALETGWMTPETATA